MKKKRRESGLINHLLRATVLHSCRFHAPLSTFLPFISAVSGCLLLFFALLSLLSPPPPFSSLHHHHLRLPRHSSITLDSEAESRTIPEIAFRVPSDGGSSSRDLWSSRLSNLFFGCSNASHQFLTADKKTEADRYLLIATSGGLNQQRTGITDAVVAAYILNATLVVPNLDQKSYWKDSSNFDEIFDVNWFISSLSKDVKIIKELPDRTGKDASPRRMRVPRKCTPKCYESHVLPVLKKKHAVQLTKFDYRLSNRLDNNLQKLRCRVNYHALRFTESIAEMGKILVNRMRSKTKHFIALHLRFEPDMLAFSGCYYGGGEKERLELGAIRKRWKTLHASNPDKVRRRGRCPLTPEEVGLMLRALGYGSDVHIYVASGEVYGGEETLAPLKALFPNFHTKETIASKEELLQFSYFSSRMAALDFIVCDQSDVFVTNNNGNMAKILAGRRRYFGHKPTIRPNARKLYRLFIDRNNMTWEEFASRVRTHQIGFMGEPNEVRPGRGEFHENPSACICENSNAKGMRSPPSETRDSYVDGNIKEEAEDVTDEQPEDDQYFGDVDYTYNINDHREKLLSKTSDPDTSISLDRKLPETDEIFSD